jgi:hypothetical protein
LLQNFKKLRVSGTVENLKHDKLGFNELLEKFIDFFQMEGLKVIYIRFEVLDNNKDFLIDIIYIQR